MANLQRMYEQMHLGARALRKHESWIADVVVVEAETDDGKFYRVTYEAASADWARHEPEAFEYGTFKVKGGDWQEEHSVHRISPGQSRLTLRFDSPYDLVAGETLSLRRKDFLMGLITVLGDVVAHTRTPSRAVQDLLTGRPNPADGPLPQVVSDPTLSERQAKAIAEAEAPLSWIWGPPGTGKTRTLGAIAAANALRDQRTLIVTKSNAAADLIVLAADDAFRRAGVERRDGDILRIGSVENEELSRPHRAHLLRFNKQLDAIDAEVRETHREIGFLEAQRRGSLEGDMRALQRLHELERRLADLQRLRREIISRLLGEASCLVTTIWQRLGSDVRDWETDVLAVDEASMCSIAETVALASTSHERLVLCGDPRQLPPVYTNQFTVWLDGVKLDGPQFTEWYGRSMFDLLRLDEMFERGCRDGRLSGVTLLDTQRRMAPKIAAVVSELYYFNSLKSPIDLARPTPKFRGWPQEPLVLVDPHRTNLPPGSSPVPARSRNECPRSARIASELAQVLRSKKPCPSLAIITPYVHMAEHLSWLTPTLMEPACRILTVHRTQGAEAEVVIFCLVNSGPFVTSMPIADRLKCVALSRARNQMIIVATRQDLGRTGLLDTLLRSGDAKWWSPDWSLLHSEEPIPPTHIGP